MLSVVEDKHYADLSGTVTTQRRVRIYPVVEAVAVDAGSGSFESMRTLAPPVGRGWEYTAGQGWDFAAELETLPELLAEKVASPSVEAGTYDLVIDPSNLWLTIHESVGHATELDRALGYEAAYAGTSFATFDKLGTLRYGSPVMHVVGDRTTPHGLASVGYDDEGVAAQSFDIVRDGVLVGYQLDRRMAAENGLGRSNGCAFADSPLHVPIQRMANVSLQPAPGPGPGPSTEELLSGVDRGIYVVGDKSWSIDMQRYNFQFTGQRFYKIEHGRLAGQCKDVAYQAQTTEFWGALEAVGGRDTYVLGGAFNCGKAQPGQVASVSHGCPGGVVPADQRPERPGRVVPVTPTRPLASPASAVAPADETRARPPRRRARALAASGAEGCVVIIEELSEAEVRFANNTTTTNGVRRNRRVAVVSFRVVASGSAAASTAGEGPTAVGVASASGALDIEELVRASEAEATGAAPAEDAAALVDAKRAQQRGDFDDPAGADLAGRARLGHRRARGRLRAGPRRRQPAGGVRHPRRGDDVPGIEYRGAAPPRPAGGHHGARRPERRRLAFGVVGRSHGVVR